MKYLISHIIKEILHGIQVIYNFHIKIYIRNTRILVVKHQYYFCISLCIILYHYVMIIYKNIDILIRYILVHEYIVCQGRSLTNASIIFLLMRCEY